MRSRRFLTGGAITVLVVIAFVAVSGVQAQRRRVSEEDLAIGELVDLLAEYPDDAQTHYQLGILLARQDRREEALNQFEAVLTLNPESAAYGNRYRMTCIWWHEFDRCIEFLENLVEARPEALECRFSLALAYVDKMPWYKLGMVQQGQMSNRSVEQLTRVIEQDSTHWAAWYARAMNHLHWPRLMRHAPQSIADFSKALEIQNSLNLPQPKQYFELTYLGLGDALVKDFRHDEARDIWRQGLSLFPASAKLRKRLSLTDNEELEQFLKKARGLEKPIDTDMGIVWAP